MSAHSRLINPRHIPFALVLLLLPQASWGQFADAIESFPADPRGVALGELQALSGGSAFSAQRNPAGLAMHRGWAVALSGRETLQNFDEESTVGHLGARGRIGRIGWGAELGGFRRPEIQGRDARGNPTAVFQPQQSMWRLALAYGLGQDASDPLDTRAWRASFGLATKRLIDELAPGTVTGDGEPLERSGQAWDVGVELRWRLSRAEASSGAAHTMRFGSAFDNVFDNAVDSPSGDQPGEPLSRFWRNAIALETHWGQPASANPIRSMISLEYGRSMYADDSRESFGGGAEIEGPGRWAVRAGRFRYEAADTEGWTFGFGVGLNYPNFAPALRGLRLDIARTPRADGMDAEFISALSYSPPLGP